MAWLKERKQQEKEREQEGNGELVLVTGASGFIAGHTIKQLCERGYRIRGTVRQYKGKESQYEYLLNLAKQKNQIEFIECDLTKDHNWNEAVKGVKYVIHTANPMPDTDMGEGGFGNLADHSGKKKTPLSDDDYIRPAVEGMQRILDAVLNHGKSVERFVYTSSIGAINWENWDTVGNGKTVVYTHTGQWTPVGKCHVSSYAKSKTLAEQLGFEFVKKNNNPFEFVAMHPGWVVGPLLNNRRPMSLSVLELGFNGDFPVIPRIQWGVVDVRDVATAHINAMKAPKASGRRYLLVAECLWHKDITELMVYKYGKLGYPLATTEAPEALIKILAKVDPEIGNFVLPLNGLKRFVDHRPSVEDLDLVYRPAQESILEACEDLISKELVKKPMSTGQRILRKGALACVALGVLAGSLYVFDKDKVAQIKKKVVG